MIRTHDEAEQELLDAAAWYDEQRPGLGERFLAAYEHAVERLPDMPRLHARVPGMPSGREIRHTMTPGFPYVVVYEVLKDDDLVILAVPHVARKPGYWQDRSI
jgi:toxin ParE1/3/4